MTTGQAGDNRLTRDQRREAAREKARKLREDQRKKDLRNRFFLFGSLGIVLVAIVVGVVFIITSTIKPTGPAPLNMASDGIKITENRVAVQTPALPANENPIPSSTNPPGVVDIRVYADYLCPFCGRFEKANSEQISTWLDTGAATFEVHPIALLDNLSLGTKYSTRATNAAACVANYSPNNFFDFNSLLYVNQPEEKTEGLTDSQIKDLVSQAGASSIEQINQCIDNQDFRGWVNDATSRALAGPLPGTSVAKVKGTPTVLVNGQQYTGLPEDADAFANFVLKVSGQTSSTPTPTPVPVQ